VVRPVNVVVGVHGVVALVLLCSLLFAEEAGVPLPTPGELTLVAAGLLIGTGALDPWLFLPLAVASSLAGSLTGYSWARLVGEHGLRNAARRFNQTRRLERVTARLRDAGPREIAIARLTPLFRVYTTLVAGAAGVDLVRFLTAVVPATVLWVIAFTVLGVVAGAPAAHVLGQLGSLVFQGGVLIMIGAGGYLAIRAIPAGARPALARLPRSLRTALALAVDIGLIAAIVAGVLAIVAGVLAMVRPFFPIGALAGWADILIVVAVIAAFYSVATRRGERATAGEALLDTRYLTRGAQEPTGAGLRRMLHAVLEQHPAATEQDLVRVATVMRTLGDVRRLQVARLLLARERSSAELVSELGISEEDAAYALRELADAGVVVSREAASGTAYSIGDIHVRAALAELLAHRPDEEPGGELSAG
jgi:membrane protein DedA with SNARE-associated domain/DNA-binding transcriptional ArsR family regulator